MSNSFTLLNLRRVNIGKALSQESYTKKKTGGSTVYCNEKYFGWNLPSLPSLNNII